MLHWLCNRKLGAVPLFVVTVKFEVAPAYADAFLARVRRQAADSLTREAGCRRFDVAADPDRPGRVFLYEIYDDRAAFDAHLASAHFRAFDAEVTQVTRAKEVAFWELQPPG